jgi:hypothetical protein
MKRGGKDEYYMAVCNKTGGIAIYNPNLNLFLSPFADGPIRFSDSVDGKEKQNIDNISRFGRSFSIVRVPYAFKLLIQELQVMNVQMRIITEDNIDQLLSMSYSNNISQLLKSPEKEDLDFTIKTFKSGIIGKNKQSNYRKQQEESNPVPIIPVEEYKLDIPEKQEPGSPEYNPNTPTTPVNPNEEFTLGIPYKPGTLEPETPPYAPESPPYAPESPPYSPNTSGGDPSQFNIQLPLQQTKLNINNPELKSQFDDLSERDKQLLMDMVAKKRENEFKPKQIDVVSQEKSILELDEDPVEKEKKEEEKSEEGTTKKISFQLDEKK